MFSLQNRKAALCPDFSQTHHRKIRRCTDAAVSSEESGIAAAGQNSSPGGICFKTCFPSAAMGTVCAGSLITAQILACGLIAVQSVIGQKFPFRTYESVLLRVIGKTVFLRCIWELYCRDISRNPQQLQAAMHRAGVIASVQSNPFHGNPGLYLSFQMSQNQKAFSLIGRTDVYPCDNSMLAVHSGLHQIAHATFCSVVDIAAIRIACAGGASFCDLLYGRLSESRLCGKLLVQPIQIALHAVLDFNLHIDPTRTGDVCRKIAAVRRQGLPIHKATFDTVPYNFLKYLLKQVALLPLPHARFAECGVIRYRFVQFKATKPTIRKIQSHFLHQSALRFDSI